MLYPTCRDPWDEPGFFHEAAAYASRPGRPGVRAAVNVLAALPPDRHAELLRRMWREPAPPNPMSWRVALMVAWRARSWTVEKAAGGRDQAIRWFRAADLDAELLPVFRRWTGERRELPPWLRLYRGGLGPTAELARGLCWTSAPSTAAYYALHRWEQTGGRGAPVVVRCTAPREAVLWWWRKGEQEVLVAGPDRWEELVIEPQRLRALARAAERRKAGERSANERLAAELAATPEEELWGGWGLEAAG